MADQQPDQQQLQDQQQQAIHQRLLLLQQQMRERHQQQQQILRPVYQQLAPDEIPLPHEQLLARRPAANRQDEETVLGAVLDVAPDVNRKWIRDRAGYGTDYLTNFIFEHDDAIPLEPNAAGNDRLLDVSRVSTEDSFVRRPSITEEDEAIREAKIDALTIFIKGNAAARIKIDAKLSAFVKQRFPSVKCSVIGVLLKKMRNHEELLAVCELLELRGLTEGVAANLGLQFILEKEPTPWLTLDTYIDRRRRAPQPRIDDNVALALAEVVNVLSTAQPPSVELASCAVCYDEFNKKKTLPCTDDEDSTHDIHYVCLECTRANAKALCEDGKLAEGGQGLRCVDPGCNNVIPWAVVKKLLDDKKVRAVLEKRIDNEAILAIDGLENCKYCSFQMVIESPPEELKVFSCVKCRAEFCRLCKVDWKRHMGRRCDEMKGVEDAKDAARKKYEEELANAVLRQCHKCKVTFAKEDGCNKMTCRCGATQCYMCREKDISYKHFCPHMRDPTQPNVCPDNCDAKCLLWVKTTDIDRAAIERVKAVARTDRALQEFVDV